MSRQPGEKKLSKAVLALKFMKKSKEKAEVQEENEERQQLYQDQLSTLHEGADLIIRLESYVDCMSFLPCRLSFGGMDPDIEKLNEDKLTGMYKVEKPEPPELITEMTADMSALEMAMALGGNPKKRTSGHLDNGEESKEFDKKKSGRFFVPRGRGRGNSRGAGDGQSRGRGRGDSRGFGREKRMHIFSGDSKSNVQDNSGDDFQYDDKDDDHVDNKNKLEGESKDGGNHWSFNRGGYRDGGRGRGGAGFEGREGSFRGGGRGRGNEGFGRGRGDGGFGRGRGVGGFGGRDRGRGAGSFAGRGRGRDSQGFRGREGFGVPGRGRGTRGFGGRSKGRDEGFAERNQGNERDEDFLDSSHERGDGDRSYSPKAGGSGIMKGDTIDGNRESMRNNNKGKGIDHGREAEAENFNNFDGAMERYLQSITCDNPRINRGKRQPKRKRGRHSAYRDNMDGSSPVVKGEDAKSFKGEDAKSFKNNKVNDLDQFIKKLRVESGTKPEKME